MKLRPHLLGSKVAHTIALSKYDGNEHPRDMARHYHNAPTVAGNDTNLSGAKAFEVSRLFDPLA